MKFKRFTSFTIAAALVGGLLTGCSSNNSGSASKTVRLGVLAPLTGQVAVYGQSAKQGAELAIEEYNKNGGVLGKKIETVVYDTKADPKEAVNAFNKLVSNDKVDAVIGEVVSGTTLAIAPLANRKNIPLITPTATSADVTKNAKSVFRACYIDPYQGKVLGEFAADELKVQNAAIMYNTSDDYSSGLAKAFKAAFEAKGGKVVSFEGYGADNKDFKAILTNIKAKNPQVLFIPDYYNTVALIAKQVKQVGITANLLGGDGWDGVTAIAGSDVEGGYFANHYATDDKDPKVQAFITSYKAKYKKEPDALAALGYDAAVIMLEAIKKAGTTDKEKVVKALTETNVTSVTGTITFDAQHNPIKSVSMIKIQGGKNVLGKKVNP